MAKTRFFRVAVEGATTDGRAIEKQWLLDAEATYNRETYAARVNLEHIRGVTADGPFQAYGDVLSLKTETISLTVGGKTEQRLALMAEIEALDPLVAMNAKGQKLYSSIEISPNFAGSGKAYLVGLAVTDSPASLGTEMLQFAATQGEKSPLAGRKQDPTNLFSAAEEIALELVEEAPTEDATKGLFTKISAFIDSLAGKPKEEPVTPPVVETPPEAAASFAAIGAAMTEMATTLQASIKASDTRAAALETRLSALSAQFEHAPNTGFTQRPIATGGGDAGERTDC